MNEISFDKAIPKIMHWLTPKAFAGCAKSSPA